MRKTFLPVLLVVAMLVAFVGSASAAMNWTRLRQPYWAEPV